MRRILVFVLAALAAACVTINVYFPAAAAQKAADRVIDEVLGGQAKPASTPSAEPPPGSDSAVPPTSRLDVQGLAVALVDVVLPPAQAADEPNLDVSTPEIKRLTDSMKVRFGDLSPYFDSGAVGMGADGYVAVRDANVVPLADRNKVRTLVANENADRSALYREIASANKQPQWETQIRTVFAQRWAARAKSGWYVQDGSGAWSQR